MGTGASSSSHGGGDEPEEEEEYLDQGGGGQLYVSLKMENNYKLKKGELLPHVFGSVPLVGSWDSSKAVTSSLSLSLFFILNHSIHFCFGFVAFYGT